MAKLTKEQKEAKKNLDEAFIHFLSERYPKLLPKKFYSYRREYKFYLFDEYLQKKEIILHDQKDSEE